MDKKADLRQRGCDTANLPVKIPRDQQAAKREPGPSMAQYKISDVARLAGISPSVIRLWEQHGLLSPQRSAGGQRYFQESDINRIRAIQRMRQIEGLNIPAIRQRLASEDGPQAPEIREEDEQRAYLGDRFRVARQGKRFSLRKVAAALGISPSALATFERTSQGLNVSVLQRLATFYGTNLTTLTKFDNDEQAESLTRTWIPRGEERQETAISNDINILRLAENLTLLDCQKWIFKPGASSNGSYHHEGEEFIHVLEGVFEIVIDGKDRYTLSPGDSISFASNRPHSWKALGSPQTVIIWVNTPQSF